MADTNSSNGNNVARWFGTSVVAAFFTSLERCACVRVDADGEEDNDDPLLITTYYYDASSSTRTGAGSSFASASQNVHA
ncbi:hypothetical protein AAHA92_18605 [Salvia divinorum]|uniref:Uncharacterized protein n=1 Tax=Salvia divinorum TaxID=28513 RepID=A0ABD1H2N3_SALDI